MVESMVGEEIFNGITDLRDRFIQMYGDVPSWDNMTSEMYYFNSDLNIVDLIEKKHQKYVNPISHAFGLTKLVIELITVTEIAHTDQWGCSLADMEAVNKQQYYDKLYEAIQVFTVAGYKKNGGISQN